VTCASPSICVVQYGDRAYPPGAVTRQRRPLPVPCTRNGGAALEEAGAGNALPFLRRSGSLARHRTWWATSDEDYFDDTSAAAHTRITASAACTPGWGVTVTRTRAGAGRRHCSQPAPRPSAPAARMRRRSPCRLLGAVAASAWLATLATAAPGCGDHGLVARVWTQPAQATGAADANTLLPTQVRQCMVNLTWRRCPVLCQAGS